MFSLSALLAMTPFSATAQGEGEVRKLAPGIMTHIPADVEPGAVMSTHPVVELAALESKLARTPNFAPPTQTLLERSKRVKFRRTIKNLDFSFKPLRMIEVDIPQPSGKMQRKLVWYLVYRVTNPGGHLKPSISEGGVVSSQAVDTSLRFVPQFVLRSHEYHKEYLDRVIPPAMKAVTAREDPNRRFYNSVEMAQIEIPASTDEVDRSVWGVATWVDVDPKLDFFSISIFGLTNAYQWSDPPDGYKPGEPLGKGRRFQRKALVLNFWRPGDEIEETEEEIIFGTAPGRAALYGPEAREGLDYQWVYR